MARERLPVGPRRGPRSRRRLIMAASAAFVVLGIALWGAVPGPGGPPAGRPLGAGLPPAPMPRIAVTGEDPEIAAGARRAEIAAEEARLAALRAARQRLEQEVAALERHAAGQQRDQPATPSTPVGPTQQPGAPTGAAGAPVAGPTDPAARPLRIIVHHRANSATAANAASDLAQGLRAGGVEVQSVRGAPFVPSTPVVRYFHDQDQPAAARLAARLGQGWAVQDFRAFLPQPVPQTLEVWLPAN